MWDLFHHPLTEGEWFGLFAFAILIGVIGLKFYNGWLAHLREMHEVDQATALKMEMVQRGMSAEEIERVLAAKIGPVEPSIAGQIGRAAGDLVRQATE